MLKYVRGLRKSLLNQTNDYCKSFMLHVPLFTVESKINCYDQRQHKTPSVFNEAH